jgi:release factor glutamine methyltransferase
MEVREALTIAVKSLQNSSTPFLDARVLMAKVLSFSQEKVVLNYQMHLAKQLSEEFFQLVRRRKLMEPIAYIVGIQEFYGLEFYVDYNVLIPRPETELLVDIVICDYNLRFQNKTVSMLELGVGSGAVSITLANQISDIKITALDICNKALKIAFYNASVYGVVSKIQFVRSNWYDQLNSRYDYIVSNPPYLVKCGDGSVLGDDKEPLSYEPNLALYADNNGLAAYEIIIGSAHKYLNYNGRLIMEFDFVKKDILVNILHKCGFELIDIKKDLSGLDRVFIAKSIFNKY